MCIPSALSPPLPPLASSLPPPTPGGGYITMLTRSAKIPIPTPPPTRFARCPPPLPGGALITFAIPSTKAIPSHVPTLPPLAPVRPRPSRLGARVGPSDRSLPPAPPRGALITSSIPRKTIIACPLPITPPNSNGLYAPLSLPSAEGSAGSAFCRRTLEGSAARLTHYCSIKCNS